jgi:SAM-dependent methyltransferase
MQVIDTYLTHQAEETQYKELELRCMHDSSDFAFYMDLFNSHKSTPVATKTIVFVEKLGSFMDRYTEINEVTKDIRCFTKRRLATEEAYGIKFNFNIESPCDRYQKNEGVRYKYRYSFNLGKWRADFTFVKESNRVSVEDIRKNKDRIYARDACSMSVDELKDMFTRVELELEYVGASNAFNTSDLMSNKTTISFKEVLMYLGVNVNIPHIDTILNIVRELTMRRSGFVNPIDITRKTYAQMLEVGDYMVTPKLDGVRVLLYLEDEHVWSIAPDRTITDTGIKYVYPYTALLEAERMTYSSEYTSSTDEGTSSVDEYTYHVYDVFVYESVNIHDSLRDRLDLCKQCVADVGSPRIVMKQFYPVNSESIQHLLDHATNTDGLIFTSDDPHATLKHYKWKPASMMTIDFLCVKKARNEYLLCSSTYSGNIRRCRLYLESVLRKNRCNYSPIQFMPSDESSVCTYISEDDLDGRVGEFRYDNGWHLVRIRADKNKGNDWLVADYIWFLLKNPISEKELVSPTRADIYFQIDENDKYSTIRRYNNQVKKLLLRSHLYGYDTIYDIGCGKGQDILKYIEAKKNKVIMVDNNHECILEALSRWHGLIRQFDKYRNMNIRMIFKHENVATTRWTRVASYHNAAVCHLAIHHMIDNIDNVVRNLFSRVNCVVITMFDGDAIAKYVAKHGPINGKYFICPDQDVSSATMACTGATMRIGVPFQDTPVRERMVSATEVVDAFKRRKFTLARIDSVVGLAPSIRQSFSQEDAVYLSFIKYLVFEKN